MIRQFSVRRRRDFIGIRRQFPGLIQSFLPRLPFRKTAGPPFAEILFADGATTKVPGKDVPYLWRPVEPA
jgi:hypothetical protein